MTLIYIRICCKCVAHPIHLVFFLFFLKIYLGSRVLSHADGEEVGM